MGAAVKLVTFDEFLRLPDPRDGTYLELHGGELVKMTFPAFKHVGIQIRAQKLIGPRVETFGLAVVEFPLRALAEHELRRADVAVVSHARLAGIGENDLLHGAPELVVEVLSPSNTRAEMTAKRELCLANGAWEYWEIDPKTRAVPVCDSGGSSRTYHAGQEVPLNRFGGSPVAVAPLFESFATG